MTTMPDVTVVVPTYQRRRTVGATLDALRAQRFDGVVELLVVDNGCTDGTSEDLAAVAAADDRVRVLRIEVNRGPGQARNAGWEAAGAPIVAFTDDDTEPHPDWLARLVEPFASGADVVMGRTVPAPGALEQAGPFSHWVRVERPMPWFPTCNIAYRRDLLDRTGGFDTSFTERFGSSFGDDTDLGWRALEAGADVRFAAGAVVEHEVTPSDWRAHLRAAQRRQGVPTVIARHPGLRAQLPMTHAYVPSHPRALLCVAGLLAVLVRPRSVLTWVAAAVLGRPYVAFRVRGPGRRPGRGARRPTTVGGHLVADLAETAVVVRHAVRERVPLV